jgi:hypothetical protein
LFRVCSPGLDFRRRKEASTEIAGVKPLWLWLWITPATGGTSPTSIGIPEGVPVIVGTVAAFPTIVGVSPTMVATPAPGIQVGRAMRQNPSPSPPAPMTRHRVPTPTTAPQLGQPRALGWTWLGRCPIPAGQHAPPSGHLWRAFRPGPIRETRIFGSPPAHLGSNAQPITEQRRPPGPAGRWVCYGRQIRSLLERPRHTHERYPARALHHGRGSSSFRRTTRLTLISSSCWRACARS